jgi:Zn-dependent protease
MPATSTICAGCATALPERALACPACARLVHKDELERLAAVARERETAGDASAALGAWRSALELLPAGSTQHASIARRIAAQSRELDRPTAPAPAKKPMPKWLAALGVFGAMIWKLKFALVFVLSKAKLLLIGLTKWKTLLSMLVSLGVYWQMWGWPFALGFVVSMYIHEMGHVAALSRYGIRATAPMFVPGFGAFVRLEQRLASARESARVGLAGPWWGLGAAIAAWLVFLATDAPIFAAIAHAGAILNLFNLIPIWQLDGGRAFDSLSRKQRITCALAIAAAWALTESTLLALLLLGAGIRCFSKSEDTEPDPVGTASYLVVLGGLALLLSVHVPGIA